MQAELFSPPEWAQRAEVFAGADCVARELTPADAPALQAFLQRNQGYCRLVAGRPWLPDEAASELSELPPPDWPQGRTWRLALLRRADGAWRGFITLTEDLLAPGVCHLGLFLIDEAWQGRGLAAPVHQALADWAQARGARWLRLGVVQGNARAEAFWARLGYVELCMRAPQRIGELEQRIRVLLRPLDGATVVEHLRRVPRDRPPQSSQT